MELKDARLLLKKFHVPKNIVRHSEKVMEVAVSIAEKLMKNGKKIDINLIKKGCLLHDILKIVDLSEKNYKKLCENASKEDIKVWNRLREKYPGMSHPDAAYELLKEMGEEKLARLVKIHRFDAVNNPSMLPLSIEEKILTYADKRVLHDKVVSLKKRFSDGMKRYNINPDDMDEEIYEKYFEIEKELT